MADAGDAIFNLLGIARKLLAQGDWRCVLGMGAANLDNVRPSFGLGVQGRMQMRQCGQQMVGDFHRAGNVHSGRESVVRALAHVDMVIRMDGLFRAHLAAQHLNRAVGDDFIGIHIGLSARACLPYDQWEVVVQLAIYDFLRGLDDDLA